MNKQSLSKFGRDLRTSLSKRSPEILMGIGIAGMITTTVLAVKATPKALLLIDEKKKELDTEKLPPVEVVKTTWKCYIPAAISGTASIACLIGSNSVHAKRNAALATAYKLSERAFTEYREKVVETIGEKKERTVRDKISDEQIKQNPIAKSEIIVTGKGKTLFFDPLSHRYFYCDVNRIGRAEVKLNKQMFSDPFNSGVSVNDFYSEIGLPWTATGEKLGWNLTKNKLEIYTSAHKIEEDESEEHEGEPCLVINYLNPPIYDYM